MGVERYGNYTMKELLLPIWKNDIMYYESLLPMAALDDQDIPFGRLLFEACEIVEVRNAALDTRYEAGKDFICRGNLLFFPEGSSIPLLTSQELYPEDNKEGWVQERVGGGYVLFREGHFFHDKQITVTYKHLNNEWAGPVPVFSKNGLLKTVHKLKSQIPLKIMLFGDSISEGANSSGMMNTAPYLPIWGEMAAGFLREHYHTEINLVNPSVGGVSSEWAVNNLPQLLAEAPPELIILAFGMNDGTNKVSKEQFTANIRAMIQAAKSRNAEVEVIVIAPILANPETFFAGNQALYKNELLQLANEDIALVDMTGIHEELLRHKSYADLTGNNVNHPNDFLARLYAQAVLAHLIEEI
ncbi:SGNH/GDSL hydrolase family protein [Cohnella endophytica]|uniref:SGNH/GDSL hydrolase family protein n=1 Tax=Cohnella endophytica TaxID=2419778 RepID=A0A494XSU6_9BACL|nr:SGNH/GDSL hydrolase family protein [Cohnella endophytica]RKP52892.1 SGNH/GDSL hydrolase family protein [Cohnella endophytica]